MHLIIMSSEREMMTVAYSETCRTKTSTVSDNKSSSSPPDRSKWKIHETPQDTSLIPTLAVTLWLGWIGFLLNMMIFIVFFNKNIWIASIYLSACVASMLTPKEFPGKMGTRIGDWIMLQAEKYFGLKTTVEDDEAIRSITDTAAIFAFEPHDVIPYPVFCFNPCLRRIPGFVGKKACALATSAVFNMPFMKHVYSWVGLRSVDKKSFVKQLQRKESIVFVPGGVQEVTLMDPKRPNDLILYLKSRKGFVKLALLHGSPIIPVFCFNCDKSYGYWFPRSSLVNDISRKIGFLLLVFWGRFGIPYGIPKTTRIHVVIGSPINVPKILHDDENLGKLIEKYHSEFLHEMEALFDRHKDENGYGHRQLRIM